MWMSNLVLPFKGGSSDAHDDGVVAYKFSTDPTNEEIKKRKKKKTS